MNSLTEFTFLPTTGRARESELGIIGIKYMIRMRTIIDTNDSNNEEENVI